MRVAIESLRVACEKILSHLEDEGITSVEIPYDYYWEIPTEQRYITQTPDANQFLLGQLSDDFDSLNGIVSGDSPPVAYALVWIAQFFHIIGEKIVK